MERREKVKNNKITKTLIWSLLTLRRQSLLHLLNFLSLCQGFFIGFTLKILNWGGILTIVDAYYLKMGLMLGWDKNIIYSLHLIEVEIALDFSLEMQNELGFYEWRIMEEPYWSPGYTQKLFGQSTKLQRIYQFYSRYSVYSCQRTCYYCLTSYTFKSWYADAVRTKC